MNADNKNRPLKIGKPHVITLGDDWFVEDGKSIQLSRDNGPMLVNGVHVMPGEVAHCYKHWSAKTWTIKVVSK